MFDLIHDAWYSEVNELRREKRALQLRVSELESQLKEAEFKLQHEKRPSKAKQYNGSDDERYLKNHTHTIAQ